MMPEIYPSGIDYAGSVPLPDEEGNLKSGAGFISDTTVLTDGTPARTYTIETENIKTLFFDIKADKAATVIITPLIDVDDDSTLGLPSDTATTVANVGLRGQYTDIASHKVEVVVTKTEGGDMTDYTFRVRGSVN